MTELVSNPVYLADGRIDCIVDFGGGPMPYTADPNDSSPLCQAIFALAEAVGPAPYVPPEPEDILAAWRATAATSKAGFCSALLGAALISEADAVDAARGLWPAAFGAASADQKIAWAAALTVDRAGSAAQLIAANLGLTPEQLDALFQ